MRKNYRGFVGEVAPLSGLGALGWIRRDSWDDSIKGDARFGEALTFCGGEDYQKYVSQYGTPPPGSQIMGTGQSMPQICIDAGYGKEYVYTTGGNILQQRVTSPDDVGTGPLPDPEFIPEPTVTMEPEDVMPPEPEPAPVMEPVPPLPLGPIEQEFEYRQYAQNGDGAPTPVIEQTAATDVAVRDAVATRPPVYAKPVAPVADEGPNWIPLFLAGAALFLMNA